jgi:hypothetical protein
MCEDARGGFGGQPVSARPLRYGMTRLDAAEGLFDACAGEWCLVSLGLPALEANLGRAGARILRSPIARCEAARR